MLSRDAGRARDFAERHRTASPEPAYTDLDAVLIASADGLHAGQCIAAASAGKHVLCEKPMATTAADAERMTAACRAAGVRLGIAYHMRWHRGHRDLADAAHAGRFGVLRHMRAQWSMRARDDSNWRARTEVGRWVRSGAPCAASARHAPTSPSSRPRTSLARRSSPRRTRGRAVPAGSVARPSFARLP